MSEPWCLQGGRFEKIVALASAASAHQDFLLSGLHDLAEHFSGLGILGDSAQGYVQYDVRSVGTVSEASASGASVLWP